MLPAYLSVGMCDALESTSNSNQIPFLHRKDLTMDFCQPGTLLQSFMRMVFTALTLRHSTSV